MRNYNRGYIETVTKSGEKKHKIFPWNRFLMLIFVLALLISVLHSF